MRYIRNLFKASGTDEENTQKCFDWMLVNLLNSRGYFNIDDFVDIPPDFYDRRIKYLHDLGTWGIYRNCEIDTEKRTFTFWSEEYAPLELFKKIAKILEPGMRIECEFDQYRDDYEEDFDHLTFNRCTLTPDEGMSTPEEFVCVRL